MEVVHLNQKQLATRWHLSEACLERWRNEGNLPSGRAGYFELLRVPAERIERFQGMGRSATTG